MADDLKTVSTMVTSALECRGCGESRPIPVPCSLERFLAAGGDFQRDHAACSAAEAGASARTFGARLRLTRTAAGLTQEAVARVLEIPTTSLSHWETGRREPSLRNLRKLSAALGVRTSVLLGEEEARG